MNYNVIVTVKGFPFGGFTLKNLSYDDLVEIISEGFEKGYNIEPALLNMILGVEQ